MELKAKISMKTSIPGYNLTVETDGAVVTLETATKMVISTEGTEDKITIKTEEPFSKLIGSTNKKHNPFYAGDPEAEIQTVLQHPEEEQWVGVLGQIGNGIGFGRAQQILQTLWARKLSQLGYPTVGALLPKPLEEE